MLCLSMIVKNESRVIKRCLNSVLPYINHYIIHDTGSTDGTEDIIKEVLFSIPGTVVSTPFVNFSHNRNLALEDAKKSGTEYILLIDADMELVVEDSNFKLQSEVYNMFQFSNMLKYANVRIVKSNSDATYRGSTHEYVHCSGVKNNIEKVWMIDHDDGGSKADKFARDEILLKEDIKSGINLDRSYFYLARTLKTMERYQEAIEAFEKRISLGGWDEELWNSQYSIMDCYFQDNQPEKAIYAGLKAFDMRPSRAEPLVHIARHFRVNGNNKAAYEFAVLGKLIPYPSDILFIEKSAYHAAFEYELSIVTCYLNKIALGLEMSDRLLLANPYFYNRVSVNDNLRFYLPSIVNKALILKKLPSYHRCFNACNPSIVFDNTNLIVNIRHVDYCGMPNKHIDTLKTKDQPFNTINYRLYLDLSLQEVKSATKFEPENTSECFKYDSYANGLEDMRIFFFGKGRKRRIWFVATCLQIHEGGRNPSIILGNSKKIIPLNWKPSSCEKNWLPLVMNDKLLIIYGYNPFTILEVNTRTGECVLFSKPNIPRTAANPDGIFTDYFRGSTLPRPYKDGYLFAIHEVAMDGENRVYYFRFVTLDKDLNMTRVSLPFRISPLIGIQYLSGLEIINDKLYLSWGENDSEAYIGIFALKELDL